jgi:hypothetical protein
MSCGSSLTCRENSGVLRCCRRQPTTYFFIALRFVSKSWRLTETRTSASVPLSTVVKTSNALLATGLDRLLHSVTSAAIRSLSLPQAAAMFAKHSSAAFRMNSLSDIAFYSRTGTSWSTPVPTRLSINPSAINVSAFFDRLLRNELTRGMISGCSSGR